MRYTHMKNTLIKALKTWLYIYTHIGIHIWLNMEMFDVNIFYTYIFSFCLCNPCFIHVISNISEIVYINIDLFYTFLY